MKKHNIKAVFITAIGLLFPIISEAQEMAGEIRDLQSVLDELYAEMLPLCGRLINVARGIAGFAALWYIAARVWRNLASGEPVDFYPLLRPFALGLAIMLFPSVIGLMNGVLRPLVTGTAAMVENSNQAIEYMLEKKKEALLKTPPWQAMGTDNEYDKWYKYTHGEGEEEGFLDGIGNSIRFAMAKASFNAKNMIRQWISEILQILFEASALCINTIRTFYLLVLAIIGPIVFALAVFDGLQHTLTVWIARYINVFLWLPVANLFGAIIAKIQVNMLANDIRQVKQFGDTFFSTTDVGYLIFLAIGITGYFTVPSIANYIVHAGGVNPLLYKTSNMLVGSTYGVAATAVTGAAAVIGSNVPGIVSEQDKRQAYSSTPQGPSGSSNYMHNKLSGKS